MDDRFGPKAGEAAFEGREIGDVELTVARIDSGGLPPDAHLSFAPDPVRRGSSKKAARQRARRWPGDDGTGLRVKASIVAGALDVAACFVPMGHAAQVGADGR